MGKRTVLVTGGTGVVGAWAVRALDEAGFAPVIFTRGLTVAGERILGSLAQSLMVGTGGGARRVGRARGTRIRNRL